jgi:hypothetical protein
VSAPVGRNQRTAMAAAEEAVHADEVPDSTLRTAESSAEDSSFEEIKPAKKATYRDVVVSGSRAVSPDLLPSFGLITPETRSSSTVTEGSYDPFATQAQRPETFSQWKDDNPNKVVDDGPAWTPVTYRRSRSQGSGQRGCRSPRIMTEEVIRAPAAPVQAARAVERTRALEQVLVPAPHDAIAQAEELLAPADRERISRRFAQINVTSNNDSNPVLSKGEGPSKKGKTVDPGNWGNISFEPEETNPEIQNELLNKSKKNKKSIPVIETVRQSTVQPRDSTSQINSRAQSTRLTKSRPIDQISATSYLGRTLRNMERLETRDNIPDNSGPSESEPSTSDDDDDPRRPPPPRADRKSRQSRERKSGKQPEARKITLKPIVPKEYNGTADARLFYRFVTEGTAYVTDGNVPLERQIFVLSYHLSGTAYDFYTQKVANKFHQWTLSTFFNGLFNYCFPINYQTIQRGKLRRCFQNEKTVSAYVHELEELFNLIGSVAPRDQVLKLWDGFRSSIIQALWRDGCNPEISSWEDVVNHAETIELAESVSGSKNSRSNDPRSYRDAHPASQVASSRITYKNVNRPRPEAKAYYSNGEPRVYSNGVPKNSFANNSDSRPSRGGSRNYRGSSRPSNYGNSQRSFAPKKNYGASSYNRDSNNSRPSLSEKEKAELLAAGKCFNCKETGHMSRSCPKKSFVKSSSSQPPGVSNFNVEFGNATEIVESDDEVELVDSISFNLVEFYSREGEIKEFPYASKDQWEFTYDAGKPRRHCLAHALVLGAQSVLEHSAPYPGDAPSEWIGYNHPNHRFEVIRGHRDIYYIHDLPYRRCASINGYHLRDPYFQLGQWYAALASAWSGSKPSKHIRLMSLGDTFGFNADLVLRSGIQKLYPTTAPNINDEVRFHLVQTAVGRWDIHDAQFPLAPMRISIQELANCYFDLANWYRIHRYGRPQNKETPSMQYACHMTNAEVEGVLGPSLRDLCKGIYATPAKGYNTPASLPDLVSETDSESEDEYDMLECLSIVPEGFSNDTLMEEIGNVPNIQPTANPVPLWLNTEPQPTTHGTITVDDNPNIVFPTLNDSLDHEQDLWNLGIEGRTLRSRTRLEDIITPAVSQILEDGAPYPGDDHYIYDNYNHENRFILEPETSYLYLLHDRHQDAVSYLDRDFCLHPDFQPALEYAHRSAIKNHVPLEDGWLLGDHQKMGPMLERRVETIVQQSRPFLYDCRYELRTKNRMEAHFDPVDHNRILIEDKYSRRVWALPRVRLTDQSFDLPLWYQKRLLAPISRGDAEDEFFVARMPPRSSADSFDVALDVDVSVHPEQAQQSNQQVFQSGVSGAQPPGPL